jgi:hypothetical protein
VNETRAVAREYRSSKVRSVPSLRAHDEEVHDLPQQTSLGPFSLRELIVFLDFVTLRETDPEWHRFGFPLVYNECNLEGGADLETLRDFTRVSSDFYPDLGFHYSRVIDEWYSVRKERQSEGHQ